MSWTGPASGRIGYAVNRVLSGWIVRLCLVRWQVAGWYLGSVCLGKLTGFRSVLRSGLLGLFIFVFVDLARVFVSRCLACGNGEAVLAGCCWGWLR